MCINCSIVFYIIPGCAKKMTLVSISSNPFCSTKTGYTLISSSHFFTSHRSLALARPTSDPLADLRPHSGVLRKAYLDSTLWDSEWRLLAADLASGGRYSGLYEVMHGSILGLNSGPAQSPFRLSPERQFYDCSHLTMIGLLYSSTWTELRDSPRSCFDVSRVWERESNLGLGNSLPLR